MRLIGKRSKDARMYNLPSISEVAVIIIGNLDNSCGERDILVDSKSGKLQCINDLNSTYLQLQYPLLFPYGEDGYIEEIPFATLSNLQSQARKRISIREFLT